MKTVCKKLLCLMLVAMMLVSAIPAAFAVELITPVVSGDIPADDAIQVADASATKNYTINVGSMDVDKVIASNVANYDLTDEDIADIKADKVTWAPELLYGTAYAAEATADNIHSIFVQGTTITVWLKSSSTSSTVPGGPTGGTVAEEVTITTDYCGNFKAYIGQKYLDVLPTPAQPGREFAYWNSAEHGQVTADTVVTGADSVTAVWAPATAYHLSFIDERGNEPAVIKGKQVYYNTAIGDMPTPSDRDGYVFVGWKLNDKIITANTLYWLQGDGIAYATWKLESDVDDVPMNGGHEKNGKVYLEIYANGDTGDLIKRVNITDYAKDDKITRAEVEAVAKKHVVAKAGYTLKYEGVFDEEGWWWFCHDKETNGKEYVVVNRDDGDDYVYVMVNNVKKAVADPSNPKTGDYITIAVTGMAMSAAALVSMIELKKRKMI